MCRPGRFERRGRKPHAVTRREPDRDVAPGDLAWWLERQETLEIRGELAASGLL